MKTKQGFTMLELILVVAVVGIALGIGAIGSRSIFTRQEHLAALRSVQQLFWHGATNAASRGVNLELVRNGRLLTVRAVGGTAPVRQATLPSGFALSLPDGTLATFTSPGKVRMATGVSNTFTASFDDQTYNLTVSQIGEVLKEVAP